MSKLGCQSISDLLAFQEIYRPARFTTTSDGDSLDNVAIGAALAAIVKPGCAGAGEVLYFFEHGPMRQ